MAIELTILYRGPLADCNYGCGYCPFAKRRETAQDRAADHRALKRFVGWIETRRRDRLSVFFTPWGEALTHASYREAVAVLSRLEQVEKVIVQTNLSCVLEWLDDCDTRRLRLWCTYHPGQASRRTFVGKCIELHRRGVLYSVGVVGLKEHFDEIEALRRELPTDVYLWINAVKDRGPYYDEQDVARCEAVDPYFVINNRHHASRGRRCGAGERSIAVDGEGAIRRCHFVRERLGNLYRGDIERVLQARTCPNDTCGCHIGYVYLDHLRLETVFGDALAERIPRQAVWTGAAGRIDAAVWARRLVAASAAAHHSTVSP